MKRPFTNPRIRAIVAGALVGLLLTTLVVSLVPRPAQAQIPVTDVAHIAQSVVDYIARLVEIGQRYVQLANQYRQLYYDAEKWARDAQNLKKLDKHWARNVVGTMARMEALLQRAHVLSRANPAVGSVHDRTYPGWEAPRDWWTEEQLAVETTLEVIRETLEAKHEAHRAAVDHIRTLLELKGQIKQVEGHEEVLEVIAGITAFTAEVETLAQVSADTSADAQAAYYSHVVNRQARGDRAFQDAIYQSDLHLPQPTPGSGWGARPGWWP